MAEDDKTLRATHFLDYIDELKVGEVMIAKTRIDGRLRKFVVTRVKSNQ